jgi:cation-transporting P-type ATPase C
MHPVRILHESPGRLRLALPAILNSKSRALACQDVIRNLPGVRHVHANERTANLLVLYAPSADTRTAIQDQCACWATRLPAPPGQPAARPAHLHGFRAGSLGLVVELLPHLLPLAFGGCTGCRVR